MNPTRAGAGAGRPAPPGTLLLPEGVGRALQQAAAAGYPHETCGLLLGRAGAAGVEVLGMIPVRNLDQARARDRYSLDPDGFAAADEHARAEGLEIVGFWHSHPDHPARPSPTDREHAWEEYVYVIVPVARRGAALPRAWRLQAGEFAELQVRVPASPAGHQEASS